MRFHNEHARMGDENGVTQVGRSGRDTDAQIGRSGHLKMQKQQ